MRTSNNNYINSKDGGLLKKVYYIKIESENIKFQFIRNLYYYLIASKNYEKIDDKKRNLIERYGLSNLEIKLMSDFRPVSAPLI